MSEEHFSDHPEREPLPDLDPEPAPAPEPDIEAHRADDDEADAMLHEHPGPADPPRTGSVMVGSGVRVETGEGVATHVERINPPQPPAARVIDHAHRDHPEGERWPYVVGQRSFHDGRLKQPGEVVLLLPHEVAAHHRLVERKRFAEFGIE